MKKLCTSRFIEFIEFVDFSHLQYASTTEVSNSWGTVSWIGNNSTFSVLPEFSFWTIISKPCNLLYVLIHGTRTKPLNINLTTVEAICTLHIETINPSVPQRPVQSPLEIVTKCWHHKQTTIQIGTESRLQQKYWNHGRFNFCSTVIKCVKGTEIWLICYKVSQYIRKYPQHLRFSHTPSCEEIADNTNSDSDSHGN